jgi:hypothetical protein
LRVPCSFLPLMANALVSYDEQRSHTISLQSESSVQNTQPFTEQRDTHCFRIMTHDAQNRTLCATIQMQ